MQPFLFQSESFTLAAYGPVYLLSFLVGISAFAYLGTAFGFRFGKLIDIAFQFSIAGEIGAHLTFMVTEWAAFAAGDIGWKQFLLAGRVVLGGVLAGVLAAMWLFRRNGVPVWAGMDAAMTGVAVAMGTGRIGCLLAGCCFGQPTDWWWGFTFTNPLARAVSGTPIGVPLHPTQILQMLDGFVLFLLLYFLFFRRRFDGQVTALFFMLQGLSRFLIEFLRGDPRGGTGGLATSQWIGLGMIVAGIAIWKVRSGRGLTPTRPPSLRPDPA